MEYPAAIMVQIDIQYRGELRCEATHQPSSRELQTGAPVDNQGRGESFSPTDLLATALGTCMLTIMGIAANKRDLSLGDATVQVVKHMVADPERRIGKLEVTIHVPVELDERAQKVMVEAALGCPVAQSISERISARTNLIWGAA